MHHNLWYKLLNLGVRGKIIDIIRSMYSQVRTEVFDNNEKYETFTCKLGVMQGKYLSPFLFSIYFTAVWQGRVLAYQYLMWKFYCGCVPMMFLLLFLFVCFLLLPIFQMLHGYPGVKLPRTPQSWYPWQQGNYFIWLYVWIVWIWVSMIAWWINECL